MAPMDKTFRKFYYLQGLHLSIQGVIRAREAYPPSRSAMVEVATTIERAQARQPLARSERAAKPLYKGTRKAEGDRDDPKESTTQAKREDRSATQTPRRYGGATSKCDHCGRLGHSEDRCFLKHPHLRDQRPKKRPRNRSAPRGQADEQPKEGARCAENKKAPTHITLSVDVEGAHGKRRLSALVDSGASCSFITPVCAKGLGLVVTAEQALRIHALDCQPLVTYAVHQPKLHLEDSEGKKLIARERLVAANMAGFDLIFGLPWLQRH
ncbi:MAG: hypothetical protein M1826_003071 [Phylliscum demangeonii]|nr:MAG: hypothetical protein M1826_003071 [Phylliscum demangeonii]